MTETNNKIQKPRLYDKAVNDPIHSRHRRETIKKKLQNLENHQIWEYHKLPPGQKTIRSK